MSTAMPDFWRWGPSVHRLIGVKCKGCDKMTWPTVEMCPYCGSTELEKVQLCRKGKIITYSIPHMMPRGDVTPTTFAIVETEDGARLAGYVTDCDPYEIKCDMPVEIVIRRIGIPGILDEGLIVYGPKFRPIRK